jgi:hypothetical protein
MERSPAPDPLDAVRKVAEEAGAAGVAKDAAALAERVATGRLFVACLGQFKRGKSRLLDALVGERVLPAGVVPVTSALTVLHFAPSPCARVVFASGEAAEVDVRAIAAYVAEEQNPENAKGVAAVEVGLPSPLLASGMCLVDTPGVGSVFAGNTAVTRRFLPHVDAVLAVLGADPPISGEELAMIDEVARETSEILVVLNKADRMDAVELAEARAFAARVLAGRLGRPAGRIFEVSATEALAGAPGRDFPALVEALKCLAATSGAALVGKALRKGVDRLAERLLGDLDEQIGALTRPAEASERRLAALRACVAGAERSLRDLGPLLQAEQARLAGIFEQERARFLERSRDAALRDLSASIDAWPDSRDARHRAADLAQEIARQRIAAWEAEVGPLAERLYRGAVERFAALVNGVLQDLERAGEGTLAAPPRGVDAELGFCGKKRPQFHELLTLAEPGAGARLLDRVRSRGARARKPPPAGVGGGGGAPRSSGVGGAIRGTGAEVARGRSRGCEGRT